MTVVIVLFLTLVGAPSVTDDTFLLALVGAAMTDQISRVGSRLAEMRGPK